MLSSEHDAPLSGADKAAFVKAMLEGVPSASAPVEMLRKIPAPTVPVHQTNPASEQALALAALIETKLAAGDLQCLTAPALQALMAALCKLYGAQTEAREAAPILPDRESVPATEVMQVCGALLEAVGLQVFELGMWQSWSGR